MSPSTAPRALPALFLSLALVAGCPSPGDHPAAAVGEPAPMESLVTAEWLRAHLDDPDLVVLDSSVVIEADGNGGFHPVSGRTAFDEGHIPGAGFADLMGDLADDDSPMNFAVPAPAAFAAAMGALGVGDDTRVVLYDSAGGQWAARVWWMLRWIGFDNAALLDGGRRAWTDAGYELSVESPAVPARTLTVKLRPELIVDQDEVRAAIDDQSVELIDALPPAHYRGDFAMYARPGHIPTATNVPSNSLVDEAGRFRPGDELDSLFTGDRDKRTITYCGGGIAASADAFVMTRLGFRDVAVYTASLQEWTADPDNPMVTGNGELPAPE